MVADIVNREHVVLEELTLEPYVELHRVRKLVIAGKDAPVSYSLRNLEGSLSFGRIELVTRVSRLQGLVNLGDER